MEETAYAKLLAVRNGVYSLYVFRNLDTNKYIMCTKLPNWAMPNIEIGEVGFLKFQHVKAGEEYFNPATETTHIYKYTNIYLVNFVKETDIIKNTNINL